MKSILIILSFISTMAFAQNKIIPKDIKLNTLVTMYCTVTSDKWYEAAEEVIKYEMFTHNGKIRIKKIKKFSSSNYNSDCEHFSRYLSNGNPKSINQIEKEIKRIREDRYEAATLD